ncbi:MAG: S8 family serine peptidase [bacterium]|nr:S8 family serine peptidase [bacterium]
MFSGLLAAAVLGTAAAAQDRMGTRALEAIIARSPQVRAHVLHVKLREGSGVELVEGRLRSRAGVALEPLQAVLDGALLEPSRSVTSVFSLPWHELDRLHRVACENLPANNRPGHLGLWYRIELPTATAASVLAAQLWELELVEHVTREAIGTVASARPLAALPPLPLPLPLPQDIPPPTPDFRSLQQTHEPSPLGHGTWRAQGVLGARGRGVRFLMVESEWNYGHEDVSGLVQGNVIGPVPGSSSSEANHGTAGASMILADRNEYGITGIADESEPRFLSQLTNGGVPNTLLLAGANAQSGDVVMLVMMFLLAQNGLQDWVPFELLQPVFDATLTLTGNGVITVVSAGNGDNNLDDPRFFRRFDRTFRDSGAIMVTSTEAVALDKAPFSNYGSRIDANSWGDDVMACGIGTLFFPNNDRRQTYTADYTGTSSAVPSIAGMVLAMQGAAARQLGQRLTLSQIRQMLWTHGPQSPDHIGRRPDLPAILTTLGIADGLALSHPDVAIGGSETVTVTGPAGAGAFLFAAFDTGSTNLGFNRDIHLALGATLTVGFVPMPLGTAGFSIAIPNDPGFVGLSLYLQAGVLQGGSWHVTNSGQLSIW